MNVLLINGSPHENGCTYTALSEVAKTLEKNGVRTRIYHIGKKAVHGCIACGVCQTKGRCAFDDDPANEMRSLMQKADGIVIGSPVYYAGPNGRCAPSWTACSLQIKANWHSSRRLRLSVQGAAEQPLHSTG